MAEEVLGVGFEIHGGGNDLTFPHHENEAAQTRAARGAELSRIWMHNGMLQMGGEKMAKSVGNIALAGRRARREHGRDAVIMFFVARPLPPADAVRRRRRWRRRAASVRRRARGGAAPAPGPSPADLARAQGALLRRAGRRLQHADGAGRGLRAGSARPTAASPAPATPTCARCCSPRRWTTCSTPRAPTASPTPAALALLEQREARPRRARLRPRPIACATSSPRRAGRCATPPTARSSCAWIRERRARPLRAQPGPRGAARGAAPGAPRLGDARGGARAVAARRRGASRRAGRDRRARRAPTPTRACAPRSAPIPYADAAELLARPDPLIVVLDEVQDPQNLGAICRTAECVGADGVVIPERRSAEVTPAVCKASAGAVEHLPIARVRNVADFLGRRQGGRLLVLRRGGRGRRALPAARLQRGLRARASGAEGRGLRPRVAAACDQLVALPLRGHVAVAQRERRGGRAAVRDLAEAQRRLTALHKSGINRRRLRLNLRLSKSQHFVCRWRPGRIAPLSTSDPVGTAADGAKGPLVARLSPNVSISGSGRGWLPDRARQAGRPDRRTTAWCAATTASSA